MLDGKVVAVTGAGRGIGRCIAIDCAAAGAKVVVADYGVEMDGSEPTSDIAESVVAEIRAAGGEAIALASDVSTMEGGAAVVDAGIDQWGYFDGVVCVAGILRERMLFNMSEEEWDDVLRVHLKGTFTVYRAASAYFRKAERPGSLVAFTSACGPSARSGSPTTPRPRVASCRSRTCGARDGAVQRAANVIAPVARTRMSANVPAEIEEMGDPEDVAPMAVYLLSDEAQDVTGQVYTVVGNKIAVWSQPKELRSMYADGRWKPEDIAKRLPSTIKTEPLPFFAMVEGRRAAAAAGEKPNA